MPAEDQNSESMEQLRERIAELEADNRRWMHLAGTNRLTQLPNSLMLYQVVLPSEVRNAGAGGATIACALISPDGLGDINQAFGRSIGDELIVQYAGFLKQRIAPDERLFHPDGANFVILIANAAEGRARRKATEIRTETRESTFKAGDREFDDLSCSGGVATIEGIIPADDISKVVDGLYHELSVRLDRAKHRGGNVVVGSSRKEQQRRDSPPPKTARAAAVLAGSPPSGQSHSCPCLRSRQFGPSVWINEQPLPLAEYVYLPAGPRVSVQHLDHLETQHEFSDFGTHADLPRCTEPALSGCAHDRP